MRGPLASRTIAIAAVILGLVAAIVAPAGAVGPTWAAMVTPNPAGATDRVLNGVSCPAPSMCMAVGTATYMSGSVITNETTIAERWDGAKWWLSTTPAGDYERLLGVTCTSSSNCIAVGVAGFLEDQTLIEHWDGAHWSTISSPDRDGATQNRLEAISCTSGSNCVAVGQSISGSSGKTLVERWNGATWTIVASPNPSTGGPNLRGVSCTSASSCVAVGYRDGSLGLRTFTERWNGSTWSIVPSPNGAMDDSVLSAVKCTSDVNCIAVGYSESSFVFNGPLGVPLAVRWNGTKWSVMPTPKLSVSNYEDYLSGVTCTTATSCYAIGTVTGHWNGAAWSIMPKSSSVRGEAIACTSDTNCIAVGGTTKTFAARYS